VLPVPTDTLSASLSKSSKYRNGPDRDPRAPNHIVMSVGIQPINRSPIAVFSPSGVVTTNGCVGSCTRLKYTPLDGMYYALAASDTYVGLLSPGWHTPRHQLRPATDAVLSIPTKTPLLRGQSYSKSSSFFKQCFHVDFIRFSSRAFFSNLVLSVRARSIINFLLIARVHRLRTPDSVASRSLILLSFLILQVSMLSRIPVSYIVCFSLGLVCFRVRNSLGHILRSLFLHRSDPELWI